MEGKFLPADLPPTPEAAGWRILADEYTVDYCRDMYAVISALVDHNPNVTMEPRRVGTEMAGGYLCDVIISGYLHCLGDNFLEAWLVAAREFNLVEWDYEEDRWRFKNESCGGYRKPWVIRNMAFQASSSARILAYGSPEDSIAVIDCSRSSTNRI